jgi:PAS domain S-box-containing protein
VDQPSITGERAPRRERTLSPASEPPRAPGQALARQSPEAALQASEARYRRLFEAAKDGILILDAQTGAIVDVNPFLVELTGYTRSDFLGKRLWEIGPFKDVAASRASFADLQANDYVRYDDLPLLASDGRKVDVEFVSNVYEVAGQRVIQCNVRDITARKQAELEHRRLEEQLRTAQKMEAIGSLAGGVAHDFNNLLSVILSYTGCALEAAGPTGPLHEDLLEVMKAAERAATLTRQLLAFSRKQVTAPVRLDLNRVVLDVGRMLQRVLGEDVELVRLLAPELGAIRADLGQMEQVLLNLVVNARDAMPEGGKLVIETSNVEIAAGGEPSPAGVGPGSWIRLAVTDTGCGMDRNTRSRLFEPFFTTKEVGKGTGLGLSMVYGIVNQSGGAIRVESEPGRGSRFELLFPRDASAGAGAERPEPAAGPATGTETILVVEDEEALRRVVKRTLEAAGYTVLAAEGGAEALRVSELHAGPVHLLLTDVVMPRMDGRAVARALTKARPGLEVLYMSGYTNDALANHGGLEAGIHLLLKPFTAGALALKVRQVLDGAGDSRRSQPPEGATVDQGRRRG